MSCSIAVANSPVFSPSRVSIFCKTTTAQSPENLSINHHHHNHHHGSSPCGSSGGRPSSPFRLRIQNSPSGLRVCKKEECGGNTSSSTTSSSFSPGSSSATFLKRKRPARIDIPVASLNFEVEEKSSSSMVEMEEERESYSVYCKKGRRETMEDRYTSIVDLKGDSKQAFFGVFDGHGGSKAAEYAAENLDKNIIDEVLRSREEEIVDAVKNGYLKTDSEFLKQDVRGGTCCVTALITKGDLIVSNAGDCRAVMSEEE